VTIEDTGYRLS